MAVQDRSRATAGDAAAAIEARTQQLGRVLYARSRRYRPSLLEAAGDGAMQVLAVDARFRARVLRFIDALAGLDGDRSGRRVRRLLHEYLSGTFPDLPLWLRALLPVLRSERWPAPLVATVARTSARAVASRFIARGGAAGIRGALRYLGAHGRFASFDVLGEYVASEQEADAYRDQYLELIRVLGGVRGPESGVRSSERGSHAERTPDSGLRTPGGVHVLQVSVKLSSLTADFNPVDPEGTLARVSPRLGAVIEAARRHGVGVTLDMERYETRDLVDYIFAETFGRGGRFAGWDGIGVVVQAYLRDADQQVERLLRLTAERGAPVQVRLVKGAYWDYETVVARANGWPAPVWEAKADTDRTFERLTDRLLGAYPRVRLAVASHNLRSHARAEAAREAMGLPAGAVEHQTLYRTAEGISRALAAEGWPVRDYVPLGDLLPGMAYLVRRILENSSQAGFLLQSRSGESVRALLAPPAEASSEFRVSSWEDAVVPNSTLEIRNFHNHPPRRLFDGEERAAFAAALEAVRAEFGREYPLWLGDEAVRTGAPAEIRDRSHPDAPPIALVHQAGQPEAERALALANAAAGGWAARPVAERAEILRRAAGILAERRDRAGAWMVHEAAKSWVEALADADEAIDYLRYYADQAEQLAPEWTEYRPRGVVAVIPPWNFPMAIPCGMTSAALVCGNAVVLKPAEQTPVTALLLVEALHQAGVPREALIWLPGPGEQVGATLVSSPLVDMVAFTGSRAVGTAIYREGSGIRPARGGLRATVAEMGGKNAIVVFPDADLDEAVVGILRSAFGHANQKCSAASRVLIHHDVYPRLRQRLVEGARSLQAGAADQPGTLITPLIDDQSCERVLAAGATARTEGRELLNLQRAPRPSTVLGPELVQIAPRQAATARTTQEEIFGPVLALIPFEDEDEAVKIANDTPYALTAGVFSRSPGAIARMSAAIDAGNLYVNRPITGARVGVEPFGGHKLSGTGPKAGGEDYLWAFVTSRGGLRGGEARPDGAVVLPDGAVQPWTARAQERSAALRRVCTLLSGEWRARWHEANRRHDRSRGWTESLEILKLLLGRLDQIAEPRPTVPLPGQHTVTRWDTPRGCGVVVVDWEAGSAALMALIAGALLAGNGVIAAVDPRRRGQIELLAEALRQCGVPATAFVAAPEDVSLAAMLALPAVTFAAVDAGEPVTREAYRLLGEASGEFGSPHLKALISLVDGPGPRQHGFLRRFALPKTVAIQTLHLGADLELTDASGE